MGERFLKKPPPDRRSPECLEMSLPPYLSSPLDDVNPTGDSPQGIFATGNYLYVADNEDGLYVFRRIETSVTQPWNEGRIGFHLEQNFPNPFNPTTSIRYTIGDVTGLSTVTTKVKLAVYDLLGREVAVLVDEKKDAGVYEVKFDGTDLSSGMYFYRLQAGAFVQTRRLLLLR